MGMTKIQNLCKKEEDYSKFIHFFKNIYENFLECYSYYASLFPINEVFCVNLQAYNAFLSEIKIIDQNLT